MIAHFMVGRRFKALKRDKNGKLEEIKEPVIIEYVTNDREIARVEIEKGKIKQITKIQSEESLSMDVYYANDLKNIGKKPLSKIEKIRSRKLKE